MNVLHLDFETYSAAPIEGCGVHVYVADPSFAVTVIAWAYDNGPVRSVTWPYTSPLPEDIRAHIMQGGLISAHNAAFESAILRQFYCEPHTPEQLDCTMQRAFAYGIPASLLEAGLALGLSVVKDETERKLMLEMGKPHKSGVPLYQTDPARLARLEAYCRQDVEAERALAAAIPELSDFEKKVSALSTRSNDLGIGIDPAAVKALQVVGAKLTAGFVAEAEALSGGAITDVSTQHVRMLPWLAARGLPLPGLGKEIVAGALAAGVSDPVNRRLLELRQLSAKSSLAKLPMMTSCVGADGRARDQIQYYGAGRTGRWAGRLIQPQNLPRPDGLDAEVALRTIMAEGEVPELVYANPLKVISACLRPCIVAGAGKVLVALDLSQIEARVTAWLAGETALIEAFAQGRDIYTEMALKLGSDNRQLGKVMVLACQYGMGWETFQKQAREQYGVAVTIMEAMDAVRVYREENPQIQILWWDMETAALGAIGVPNKRWPHYGRGALGGVTYAGALNRIAMKRVGPTLAIRKPNGGKLTYHNPRSEPGKYDVNFVFDGPGRKSGVWKEIPAWGGFLTENITQAVARDVMAEAIVRIYEDLGLVPVMTVHDEAVYELDEIRPVGQVKKIEALFNKTPEWALGLPIASETKCGGRYVK